MGLYADAKLLEWWEGEYANQVNKKLDMGKSCIRFKYTDDIPYNLIGELCRRLSVEEWIRIYEHEFKKKNNT